MTARGVALLVAMLLAGAMLSLAVGEFFERLAAPMPAAMPIALPVRR